MNFDCNLQIDFKHEKHCNKLEKYIKKDPTLSKFFDCRLYNTIMFKFNDKEFRDKTKLLISAGLKHSSIKKRKSGIDFIYVRKL
jgi:hypothetical protein